jgi:tight adherence protein B
MSIRKKTIEESYDSKKPTDYRDYALSRKEATRYFAVAASCFALLGFLFYHNIIIGALMALCSIPCKKFYRSHLGTKRRQDLAVQFKDLLASLSASFTTGRQMTEALAEAEDNIGLIYPDDAPIIAELTLIGRRLGAGRESERTVLFDFADRSASPDIVSFVDVYFTCMTTGADTVSAITRASELIMDKLSVKNELRMLTAQKRLEGMILTLMPPLILAFLSFCAPDYIAPLYGNPVGALVMTISLITMTAAFYWSTRITDIEL